MLHVDRLIHADRLLHVDRLIHADRLLHADRLIHADRSLDLREIQGVILQPVHICTIKSEENQPNPTSNYRLS